MTRRVVRSIALAAVAACLAAAPACMAALATADDPGRIDEERVREIVPGVTSRGQVIAHFGPPAAAVRGTAYFAGD